MKSVYLLSDSKRSLFEIYIDVLNATKKRKRFTQIMREINLSWRRLEKILNVLMQEGLIVQEKDNEATLYKITETGEILLRLLTSFSQQKMREKQY